VFYTTAAALVQELLVAKRDLKLNEMIKKLDSFEAIVIDDISYVPYTAMRLTFFCASGCKIRNSSVVITSNLLFQIGKHLQGSDDYKGCDRSTRAPFYHSGVD